ncbi:MAG: hypothetical protein IPK63_19730 [Candidatus Competibacteraceae bacterium]|nr:hypothetical protein [Candidatus Competibacteraceae bacterium]
MNLQIHRKQLVFLGFAAALALSSYLIPEPQQTLTSSVMPDAKQLGRFDFSAMTEVRETKSPIKESAASAIKSNASI